METAFAPPLPPRPRGNRLLGSALALQRSQIAVYERAMLELGDVVRLVVGPPGVRFELICVFHPDAVQHVLASADERYSKDDPFFREVAALVGSGLLTSEGEPWLRQRRLIQPLFTPNQVATYGDLMVEETSALAERWEPVAAAGGVVDAHRAMTQLTMRVVGRAIFGADVDEAVGVIGAALPVMAQHGFRRAMSPVAPPASWPTPGNVRVGRAKRAVLAVVDRLIERRKVAGAEGQDLLSRLLRARDEETGAALDAQQVRDEALLFLLAGHETTACALTFALDLLGRHSDEQKLVSDEVDEVLGGRPPGFDDAAALARVGMVFKETMRLYPPGYALSRCATVDDVVGGYRIPAGSTVVLSQWATHRHPRFWVDPPRFDPERFSPEQEAERHRYAYFPFGRGPRACIGTHFAMLEGAIALAVLLQRFELQAPQKPVEVDSIGATLRPKSGVPIRLTKRQFR